MPYNLQVEKIIDNIKNLKYEIKEKPKSPKVQSPKVLLRKNKKSIEDFMKYQWPWTL